ncbi:putative Bet v I/Major latex protein [Helianthus debilis subsp. tardiflorus]
MDVVSMEVEITSSLSPSKLFNVFSDFDTIAPKVIPQVYKSITLIQGDGGVGSIKSVTFNDGNYTLFEGDALSGVMDTATHHIKFIPSTNGGSVYKHTTLVKFKGDAKLTDDFINLCKETLKNSFNAIESYAIDHPDAY